MLVLALALPSAGGAFEGPEGDLREPPWLVIPLLALAVLPLAARRYRPVSVLAVTLTAAVALDLLAGTFQMQGAVVALYTVAAHCDRKIAIRAGIATAGAVALTIVGEPVGDAVLTVVATYAIFAAAWTLGDNMRTRRAYLRGVEERADRLERERVENVRRATAEEQARIARELHDVIAHIVSVMVVQAAAAGDVFHSNPARAREALASIEATGREALAELRRLLGQVRTDEGDASFAPQPGLRGLAGLAEQVRRAGIDVDVKVEGVPIELPAGVDLAAYRVAQEAITNTLKHASASHVAVTVRFRDEHVEVEVVDDGVGDTTAGDGLGHGIIGMRERAALYGGELRAEPQPGGGFRVFVSLPLAESNA
jgi:signal transduction histidine kinase